MGYIDDVKNIKRDKTNYFDNQISRAKQAKEHTKEVATKYASEITQSIEASIIYTGSEKKAYDIENNRHQSSKLLIWDIGSIEAIKKIHDLDSNAKIAVLNFASYKHPGGMFLKGSKAQEECLCHASFLYNVLSVFPQYYEDNQKHLNRALYTDRAIYSPNVVFNSVDTNNVDIKSDVITCAAPNIAPAIKYNKINDISDNPKILNDRIKFILDIAAENKVDSIILGAFGCGVFMQDPIEVAKTFKNNLFTDRYKGCFKNIIFAIPDATSQNFKAFKKVFNNI